jgi:hypothetical protein
MQHAAACACVGGEPAAVTVCRVCVVPACQCQSRCSESAAAERAGGGGPGAQLT